MAFRKYPPANQIASPTELRELYNDAVGEINNYKKMASAANYTTRALAKDKEKFKNLYYNFDILLECNTLKHLMGAILKHYLIK